MKDLIYNLSLNTIQKIENVFTKKSNHFSDKNLTDKSYPPSNLITAAKLVEQLHVGLRSFLSRAVFTLVAEVESSPPRPRKSRNDKIWSRRLGRLRCCLLGKIVSKLVAKEAPSPSCSRKSCRIHPIRKVWKGKYLVTPVPVVSRHFLSRAVSTLVADVTLSLPWSQKSNSIHPYHGIMIKAHLGAPVRLILPLPVVLRYLLSRAVSTSAEKAARQFFFVTSSPSRLRKPRNS